MLLRRGRVGPPLTRRMPKSSRGQLVKIEGELYVMRSADGEEFRFHVKVGDKIEVEITRQGTVETIRLSGE